MGRNFGLTEISAMAKLDGASYSETPAANSEDIALNYEACAEAMRVAYLYAAQADDPVVQSELSAIAAHWGELARKIKEMAH